jgi:hypothetical protein
MSLLRVASDILKVTAGFVLFWGLIGIGCFLFVDCNTVYHPPNPQLDAERRMEGFVTKAPFVIGAISLAAGLFVLGKRYERP